MALNWAKSTQQKRAKAHGTRYHASRPGLPDDLLDAKTEQQLRNREYRRQRLAGETLLSYTEWMEQRSKS